MCSLYAKLIHVLYLRQGVLWCRRILVGHHTQDSTTKRGRHLSPATQAERETNRKLYSLLLETTHLNLHSSDNGQLVHCAPVCTETCSTGYEGFSRGNISFSGGIGL